MLKFYFGNARLLSLRNKYKIVVPLFGAAYAAPNKGTQFYTDYLGLQSQCWILLYMVKFKDFQGLVFFKYFSRQI